jgi:hypothetical protein
MGDVADPEADERVGEPQNRLAWGQPELQRPLIIRAADG